MAQLRRSPLKPERLKEPLLMLLRKADQLMFRVFLPFVFYCLTSLSMAHAAISSIVLNESKSVMVEPKQVEFLKSEGDDLTLEQVISPAYNKKFQPYGDKESINFGLSPSTLWVRFSLRNESQAKWYLLLNAMLGAKLNLHVFPERDVLAASPELLSGEQIKRLDKYRRFAWSLDIPRDVNHWVYLEANNGDSDLRLPIEFLAADEMLERSNWTYLLFGCVYFSMFVLALYQFVNAVILRELSYATLGVFMLAMMVAFHRSSPAFSLLNSLGSTDSYFSTAPISIMVASFLAFSRQALNTRLHIPKIDRLFQVAIAIAVIMIFVIGLIPGGKKLTILLGLLSLLLIWFSSIYLGCKGHRTARNFAWIFLVPVAVQVPNAIILILGILGHWKTELDIAVVASTLIFVFLMAVIQTERIRKMRENMQKREAEMGQEKALGLIARKLAKYVSPQIYDSIFTGERDVKLGTDSKELTIFFSDIVDFTYTSEQMRVDELAEWLNGYLNEMAQIALNRKGTIDKFIGDAVMVFYGDPLTEGPQQDAINCVYMALAMQKKAHALGIKIRIGINSGTTTVGNFGSDKMMDYTVVGRSVNLAARLEKMAEPGRILISEQTYELINKSIACEEHADGLIIVKGFEYPVKTYWVKQSF